MSSKAQWKWDRKAKRWRHGGRWASVPPASVLRKLGVDKFGKKVKPKQTPKKKIAKSKPVKKKVSKPIQRLKKIVKSVSKPRNKKQKIFEIEEQPKYVPFIDGVINSSNWNKKIPDNTSFIFENILNKSSEKTGFDPSDILVYQHGLKFLGHEKLDKSLKQLLYKREKEFNIKIKFADTNIGTEVYLFLGKEMKLNNDVVNILNNKTQAFSKIYEDLVDYWGSLEWWYWFETEESLYE